MGPKVNFNNTNVGKIGTLADLPKDSSAEINFNGGSVAEIEKGVVERDRSTTEVLGDLLRDLGIDQDSEKREAFRDFLNSIKDKNVSQEQIGGKIRESRIFTLLGSSERMKYSRIGNNSGEVCWWRLMNDCLKSSIRFAMSQGWIENSSNSLLVPALEFCHGGDGARKKYERSPNILFDGCLIKNCKSLMSVDGGLLIEVNNTHVTGCENFAEIGGDVRLEVNQSEIQDCATVLRES